VNSLDYSFYREARDLAREVQQAYQPECLIEVTFQPASATPMNWVAKATKKCGCTAHAAGDTPINALEFLLAYVTEEVDTANKHQC